jgi:hypothetical protein
MERKRERDEEKTEGEMEYKASEAYMNEEAPAAPVAEEPSAEGEAEA